MGTVIAGIIVVFVIGTVMSGVTTAAIAVYWFGDFDPKYRDVPTMAFELELWGVLVFALIAALMVGLAAFILRNRLSHGKRALIYCWLLGGAYPIILRLVETNLKATLGIESLALPVIGWLYLILFPVLCVFFLAPPRSSKRANAV